MPHREAGTDHETHRVISRNVVVLIAGKIAYLLSRVALPPFVLGHVGLDEYGIWACCLIVVTYLGMGVFGISSVYIRYVAEYHARRDTGRISELLTTGLTVTGALGVLVLAGAWLALPSLVRAFDLPPAQHETAFVLMFGTVAAFVIDLSLGAFGHVLIGLQRIAEHTVVWVLSSLLEVVLIVVLLLGGFGVCGLLIAFAARFAAATLAYAWLCRAALPGLSLRPGLFRRSLLRLFYGYGSVVQISGLLGIFLYSVEKLLAGFFVGVGATALFDVGEKFPVMVSGIPASITSAFLPAMSRLHTLERRATTQRLYVQGARYVSMLGGLMMAFLAGFSGPIVVLWLGPDPQYANAALILAVFCLPFQMHVTTGPGSALLRGIGEPARELLHPLTQLALVALTVAVGFATVGRTVPVIAVCVGASMVTSALVYQASINRFLGVPQAAYFARVVTPGVVPYLLALALAALVERWAGVPGDRLHALVVVATGAAAYSVIVPGAVLFGLCDRHERDRLARQLLEAAAGLVPARWQPAWLAQHAVAA